MAGRFVAVSLAAATEDDEQTPVRRESAQVGEHAS